MTAGKKSRSTGNDDNDPNPARIRNHKFESFTDRVARLKIDPIRRNRKEDLDGDDVDSHFKNALNHWKELNLSDSFSNFVQEVESLCESLPQILHHRSRIVEILLKYIGERNVLSLESLLSLTSSLARDLGAKFEDHFPNLLVLILDVAAKHKDIEVVEWSFSCLAWLFKYLVRLLVPDLRPTYDIMTKALGKENHKPFIARFAAEAMSFLVRKAASIYFKDPKSLDQIVRYVLDDIETFETDHRHFQVYQYGVMSMFANTMQGVETGFHTSASVVYSAILKSISGEKSKDILVGVTTSLIHHGNAQTLSPILGVLYQFIEEVVKVPRTADVPKCLDLLTTFSAVRHGTRVSDWSTLFTQISKLVTSDEVWNIVSSHSIGTKIAELCALAYSRGTLEACSSNLRIIEILFTRLELENTMAFCIFFADMNRERFAQIGLSLFYKCLLANRNENQHLLVLTLLQLSDRSIRLDSIRGFSSFVVTQFEDFLVANEQLLLTQSESSVLAAGGNYLELLSRLHLESDSVQELSKAVANLIERQLEGTPSSDNLRFALGPALRLLITHSQPLPQWKDVVQHIPKVSSMPICMENVQAYGQEIPESEIPEFVNEIVENLSSPSKDLRRATLHLLRSLYFREAGEESLMLATAIDLEELTLEANNARTASMYVRRLAEQFNTTPPGLWLSKVLPHYCFGLLHFKLSQIWTEAIDALKQMISRPETESVITDLIFQWLANPIQGSNTNFPTYDDRKTKYNEFQCSSRTRALGIFTDILSSLDNAEAELEAAYHKTYILEALLHSECRQHALRLLKGLPELAEKRSRRLVPIFLQHFRQQAEDQQRQEEGDLDRADEDDGSVQQDILTRRDRLAVLDIFGSFTNPRMMYRSTEVYTELLRYLASGDAQLQKTALKALSTWKISSIERYSENLVNILDETRFREEIATFLNQDEAHADNDFDKVLPFLLRILYGRIISRIGSATSKGSLTTKRRAVFDALARLPPSTVPDFAAIALGPLQTLQFKADQVVIPGDQALLLTQRRQLGLLNLINDMTDSLGERTTTALPSLLSAILYCSQKAVADHEDNLSTTTKDIRRSALQCLTSISTRVSVSSFVNYLPAIIKYCIEPRLSNMASETSQSISAMLQLLASWSKNAELALWLSFGGIQILDAVTMILHAPSVKDPVLLYVIDDILKPIARFASMQDLKHARRIKEDVLAPSMTFTLKQLGVLLESNPEKRVLAASLSLLSSLATSVEDADSIQTLLRLSSSLLSEPTHRVSPKSKGDILNYLVKFIPISGLQSSDTLLTDLENALVPLLQYFKDRDNRVELTKVLLEIAKIDEHLDLPAQICDSLDSWSTSGIDEPDFNRRLRTFANLEEQGRNMTAKQWKPVIFSLLFHLRELDEPTVRKGASGGLKSFIKTATIHEELFPLVETVVLPLIRQGTSQKSELVREEHVSVFAEIVRNFPAWEKVNDLLPLLVNNDQEASFFSNILHVQQHRRLRALRRLAGEAAKGGMHSMNIAHFLIPLLEHFVLDQPDDKSEHNIVHETITTLSALALGLEWPQFRAMFKRYTTYVLTNPDLEKPAIRLLTMMTEALSQVTGLLNTSAEAMDIDPAISVESSTIHRLGKTLPKDGKLSDDVSKNLTVPLRQYVHHKDETLVSQRVPVAVTVAKLIMLLSEEQITQQLPPLLTDVSQILRSRAQESRDLARRTLVDISKTIGPAYFGFILKELKTALPRGYQLHVLSFTMHALLVADKALIENGELDYCLSTIASIIMDDIFGATGQEKDAEGYISQMREVKSRKSYDSMEIVARVSSLSHLNSLLQPLMALLEERLDLKTLKKIDELLRRLGVGLLGNQAIESQAALILCFELLQKVYRKEQVQNDRGARDNKRKRFLVNMNSAKKSNISHGTVSALHKLARFAFDLLRAILNKPTALQTSTNIKGFMPVIGEAILSGQEEVQLSVFRLLAVIVRFPEPPIELDQNSPVYLAEAIGLIRNAPSTSTEASQAALKLVNALLRRDEATVRSSDIAYLLKRIATDIDEPDRQGITLNFIKAVLYRKVMVTEVYEIMDAIAAMMIRNQSPDARNSARAVYMQFLVNYPQGKSRLQKQWAFLIKNTEYEFPAGRLSVLEVIYQLLGKVGEETVQEVISHFYLPLVLMMVNDESQDCRKNAGLLIKEFYQNANDETLSKIILPVRSWLAQTDQPLQLRIALQLAAHYIDADAKKAQKEIPLLMSTALYISTKTDPENVVDEWETIYFCLQLLQKMAQSYSSTVFSKSSSGLWAFIIETSYYPHAWVKLASSRLLGSYFADFAKHHGLDSSITLPITGSGGLMLDEGIMRKIMRSSLNALRLTTIPQELATQLIKNLQFLAQLFALTVTANDSLTPEVQQSGDESDVDGEDEDVAEYTNDHEQMDPLAFLFWRVSSILRKEIINARAEAMFGRTAALQLLYTLCSSLDLETLLANSFSILMPLHILTDPSTGVPFSVNEEFKSAHAALIAKAQETMTHLQERLGTGNFVEALGRVREHVKQRRNERRIKRRIEAVTEPEKTGLKRTKKRTQQREKRKDKNSEYRSQRRGW